MLPDTLLGLVVFAAGAVGDQPKPAGALADALDGVAAMHLGEEGRNGITSADLMARGEEEPVPLLVVNRCAGADLAPEDLKGNLA